MIIAKYDEDKRSKIWRIVTLVSSILIIIIAIFLLTKLFTANPLEGSWEDEDGTLGMVIQSNGMLVVTLPEVAGDASVDVELTYTIDKDAKTVVINANEQRLQELADDSDGKYTGERLENALSRITSAFDYSVDQEQLTLTEREYGEQMIFVKK